MASTDAFHLHHKFGQIGSYGSDVSVERPAGNVANPQPPYDRQHSLTIELPRLRWRSKVQLRHT